MPELVVSLLAGPQTGAGEWISIGSLPVTSSWLMSEADLAGGCRTRWMLLVQGCISLTPGHSAHLSFTEHPASCRGELYAYLLSAEGTSQPGKARFGPIALLWLPKRGYNTHWLTFAEVVPADITFL